MFYQKFCRICFGRDTEVSIGRGINIQRLIFAEIVAVLPTPLLVLGGKGLLRQAADALAMPKSSYKVHPLFVAIGAGRTDKQAVCIWESSVQYGVCRVPRGVPFAGGHGEGEVVCPSLSQRHGFGEETSRLGTERLCGGGGRLG